MFKKLLLIATLSLCTLALAAPSQAQHARGGAPAVRGGGGVVRGSGGVVVSPRVGGPVFVGRPYYYPGLSFGFYAGYPFYSPYYYPWGWYGYGYPYYPYGMYPYGAYYGGGAAAAGYGGLKIEDAPKDAQVFADGYYAGIVDDFDGAFQHMNLQAGPHRIEIRAQGQAPVQFEVNVQPGETITYHAK